MKTILILILSCLPLCAATTYPVLSDNTNRTITGGTTNLSLLNATNQVFTGTNTFPAASFYPANNIGMRLLWSSPTNIYIASIITNATISQTNNGDYSLCSPMVEITIPPLLGSNSALLYTFAAVRSNANASLANMICFIGSNTNFVGYTGAAATTAGIATTVPSHIFQSAGSWTNQVVGVNLSIRSYVVSVADTSISNKFFLGLTTSSSHTNLFLSGFRLYELVAP